ncbi:CheR family methyltransferase [Anaeromyxobacter dehalogenans]|uniref:MCP methyltransferase, CheR-type n=1 Tax=Anaeromyxobacter dehalogenans (strain 2CP-C) TaxID=290397 RepID=Q2IQ91_ANADE|nr:protein-glutamate O-methyltransferase CheR [Anaeromyxobacter dehalogenans]ABC80970.1 MCP methyltransferase, CheR-type [Anaeromyxobacter dehalogenans 2CP-C]
MSTGSPPGAWSHPAFAEIAAEVVRHAGLRIPAHRRPEVEEAARRAMRAAGLTDPRAYADRLRDGRLAVADLVAAVTVGETYFFRDPPQLALVRDRVVPALAASRPAGHALRAWSAACATGEEAYTLAFTLEQAGVGERSRVLGTDISRPALARARAGAYGDWSLRGPERATAARLLRREGGRWKVPSRIRARVRFEYLNLADATYPSPGTGTAGVDLVLCRNALMYLEREVVAAVARRLHAALAPGGWLLTGLADPPLGGLAPFEPVSTAAGVVYHRPAEAEPAAPRARPPRRPGRPQAPATPPPAAAPPPPPPPPPAPAAARLPAAAPAPDLAGALDALRRGDWGAVLDRAGALLATPEGAAALVHAAANAGDPPRAEALAARAAEAHPLAAELHLLHAAVLADAGRLEGAVEALRRCLYLDAGLAVAHAQLAGLLARAGDQAGARRAWRSVRRICAALPPDAPLPLGDGRCAGPLSEVASAQLELLGGGDDRG